MLSLLSWFNNVRDYDKCFIQVESTSIQKARLIILCILKHRSSVLPNECSSYYWLLPWILYLTGIWELEISLKTGVKYIIKQHSVATWCYSSFKKNTLNSQIIINF